MLEFLYYQIVNKCFFQFIWGGGKMNSIKKIAIIVVAILIGGLIYFGVQCHQTKTVGDSVVIQKRGKCVGRGLSCKHDNTCCSKNCVDGTCRKPKGECVGKGLSCNHDNTCCSKNCVDGTCRNAKGSNGTACGKDSSCDSGNCVLGVCQPKQGSNGTMCAKDSSCESGYCMSGICQAKQGLAGPCRKDSHCSSKDCPDGKCYCSSGICTQCKGGCLAPRGSIGSPCKGNASCNSGLCCLSGLCQEKLVVGGPCNNDGQCKSDKCFAGTCQSTQCVGLGLACQHDKTCCSKNCVDGTCRPCIKSEGLAWKEEACCSGLVKERIRDRGGLFGERPIYICRKPEVVRNQQLLEGSEFEINVTNSDLEKMDNVEVGEKLERADSSDGDADDGDDNN